MAGIWDLGLPSMTGAFEYRGQRVPSGRDLIIDVSISDRAGLTLRSPGGQHAWVLDAADQRGLAIRRTLTRPRPARILATQENPATVDLIVLTEIDVHEAFAPFVIHVHDFLIDDVRKQARLEWAEALPAVRDEFVHEFADRDCVLIQRWTQDAHDAISLIGQHSRGDCQVRQMGPVLVRRAPMGPRHERRPGIEMRLGPVLMAPVGVDLRAVGQRQPPRRHPLLDVYQRSVDVEARLLVEQLLNASILDLREEIDPLTGTQQLRLTQESAGLLRDAGVTSLVLLPGADAERALDRARRVLAHDDGDEARAELYGFVDDLGEHVRCHLGLDGSVEAAQLGRVGDLVGLAFDRGRAVQVQRRRDALVGAQAADPSSPAYLLGHGSRAARPRGRRPSRVTEAQVAKAMGTTPTAAQMAAIRTALETPDVALIQGPPGTGKTRVIGALRALLRDRVRGVAGDADMFLGGTQHETVDNLLRADRAPEFLPAARFGKGETAYGGEHVRLWSERLAAELEPTLQPGDSLSQVRTDVSALYSMALRDGDLALPQVRRRLAVLLGSIYRPSQMSDLLDQLTPPTTATVPVVALGHVKRLRAESGPFMDDGAFGASRVLQARRELGLSEDEIGVLSRASQLEPGNRPTDALLREMAQTRSAVLARVGDGPHAGLDRQAEEALRRIMEDLEARQNASPLSVGSTVAEFVRELRTAPAAIRTAVEHFTDAYAATCQYMDRAGSPQDPQRADGTARPRGFETVVIDEASRTPPADLLIPALRARGRVVLVGDQKQLPHHVDVDVLERLPDADRRTLQVPLFSVLFESLSRTEARDGARRVVTLTEQFRMHPRLGSFVSRQFYEPEVVLTSGRPESDFPRSVGSFGGAVAVWRDVPAGSVEGSPSLLRRSEANAVCSLTGDLLRGEPGLSVGIISFYRAQVEVIRTELTSQGIFDENGETAPGWNPAGLVPRLWVGTVDAAQGREFDIVILSPVKASTPRAGLGHLANANRMCVAMSRAKRLLVVVGDRAHLTSPAARRRVPWLADFSDLCASEFEYGRG